MSEMSDSAGYDGFFVKGSGAAPVAASDHQMQGQGNTPDGAVSQGAAAPEVQPGQPADSGLPSQHGLSNRGAGTLPVGPQGGPGSQDGPSAPDAEQQSSGDETDGSAVQPSQDGEQDQGQEQGAPDPAREWQSKYDRLKAEMEQYRQQVEPVLNWLNDPRNYAAVEAVLKGGAPQGDGQQGAPPVVAPGQQAQQPERFDPSMFVPPKKPKNYDPVDAQTDPESESAQYDRAREQFEERLARFAQQQIEREMQAEQYRQQQEQIRLAELQTQREIVRKYGATEQQAQAFIATLKDPAKAEQLESLLFRTWLAQQGQGAAQLPHVTTGQPAQRPPAPPPPVAVPGAAAAGAGAPAPAGDSFFVRR